MSKKNPNAFEEPVEIEVETAGQEAPAVDEADVTVDFDAQEEALQVHEEVGRMREAMLRMQAETENTRKRLTRELERSRKLALERIMKDLLQVRDSLERGLETDPESDAPFRARDPGVSATTEGAGLGVDPDRGTGAAPGGPETGKGGRRAPRALTLRVAEW